MLAKTDPERGRQGHRPAAGGARHAGTSALFFDNVKVPAENLPGGEGEGFICRMEPLPCERLQIAIGAVAQGQAEIKWTVGDTRDRKVFGQPVAALQNTR